MVRHRTISAIPRGRAGENETPRPADLLQSHNAQRGAGKRIVGTVIHPRGLASARVPHTKRALVRAQGVIGSARAGRARATVTSRRGQTAIDGVVGSDSACEQERAEREEGQAQLVMKPTAAQKLERSSCAHQ